VKTLITASTERGGPRTSEDEWMFSNRTLHTPFKSLRAGCYSACLAARRSGTLLEKLLICDIGSANDGWRLESRRDSHSQRSGGHDRRCEPSHVLERAL
jgi:hypothetical protein